MDMLVADMLVAQQLDEEERAEQQEQDMVVAQQLDEEERARRPMSSVEEQQSWGIEPDLLAPGCRVYCITRQAASGVSKEATEYNIWAAQLSKLSHVPITQIAQVDRIVYGPDSPVIQAYIDKKRELGAAGRGQDAEQYVFHGTGTEQALRSIATNGFIVGGSVAGVPVLNGNSCGAGVYTAIGPTTPMGYGTGTGKVMLAKTMPGLNNVHSIRPNGDWIVFRDPALLLPIAIITFGPPGIRLPGIAVPTAVARSIARRPPHAQTAAQAAPQAAAQAAAQAAPQAAPQAGTWSGSDRNSPMSDIDYEIARGALTTLLHAPHTTQSAFTRLCHAPRKLRLHLKLARMFGPSSVAVALSLEEVGHSRSADEPLI